MTSQKGHFFTLLLPLVILAVALDLIFGQGLFKAWHPVLEATAALILIFGGLGWLFAARSSLRRNAKQAIAMGQENGRHGVDPQLSQKANFILTAIVESSEDAIISKTLDGVITSWNRGAEKLFGYSAGEAIGQPMMLVIPVGREQEEDLILTLIGQGETVQHFETVRRRKDGTSIDVSVTISPVRDGAGEVVGASKIARDITDAKRERAELDRYREKLEELVEDRTARLDGLLALQRAILNSAAYAIIVTDIEGAVTHFNPAAESMLGYRADTVIGSILNPHLYDAAEVAARAAELSLELGIPVKPGLEVFVVKPRRGLADPHEWTFIRKDGSRFPGLINITVLKGPEGKVAGYLGILMDLTQQKLDDREKQRLVDILELSPDFIGSADLDGNVIYLNRAAKELVGLPANTDLASLHIRDLHPEWAASMLAEKAWPVAQRDELWQGESAVSHVDGREIPVFQVLLLHKESQVERAKLSTIIRDIRAEKWREAELAAARDLAESANAAKGQFLTNMSHELRTPLNAILGFAQLLASETIESTAPQRKEFVGHILKAGQHLLTLINEVLDLARIEAGKVTLSPEPVGLSEILSECRALLEPMCAGRNIRLLLPEQSDLHVMADRTRLKQVLLNLLTNAIKYNRDGGTVVVNCAITVPHRIRISVQDTGMGLNAEQLNKLFQPFDRLGQEASGLEGTGIGLVVTKHLVELMQGTVGVSSTVGIGSTFWISLDSTSPVRSLLTGEMPAQTSAPIAPADEKKATLLYVEDNPANLKLVEEIVGFRKDLRMISAHHGQLGVALARTHLPHVILMDIHLPGMSGAEAQQILRNDPRTAGIPVIALTASAMPRERTKRLSAGFFRYITKPIDIAELTSAIDDALAQSQSIDAAAP
jgi:PAS domain S-box-containing protein